MNIMRLICMMGCMPIFNFACGKCRNEFEELVLCRDDAVTCPSCGSRDTNRLFTGGSSFVLKGGGWYADGYTTPVKKNEQEGT